MIKSIICFLCTLTLMYSQNEYAFSDLQVEIYRVAELCENGEYELLEPFSDYPIKIHGITSQQEWSDTAQTIKNYVIANQVEAYQSQKTDENGRVFFEELEAGLYMVKGMTIQNDDGIFSFQDFMIYLPTPVGNQYDYDVEAKPKCSLFIPPEEYTVVKLWNDSNASDLRPAAVYVDILKDAVLHESVVLNSANNWSYSWEVSDIDGIWSVIETDVPKGYQVSITNNKTTFIITNTKTPAIPDEPGEPDNPNPPDKPTSDIPETGDTTPVLLYVILTCIAGLFFVILGIRGLKDKRNEKKK